MLKIIYWVSVSVCGCVWGGTVSACLSAWLDKCVCVRLSEFGTFFFMDISSNVVACLLLIRTIYWSVNVFQFSVAREFDVLYHCIYRVNGFAILENDSVETITFERYLFAFYVNLILIVMTFMCIEWQCTYLKWQFTKNYIFLLWDTIYDTKEDILFLFI